MPIVDTLLVLTGLDGWFPASIPLALLSRRSNDCLKTSLDPTFILKDLGLVASFQLQLLRLDVHWPQCTMLNDIFDYGNNAWVSG